MFVRKKTVKGHVYYQVIHGFRDAGGRVRHRCVVSLRQHATIGAALRFCRARLRAVRREHVKWESDFPSSSPRSGWVLREIKAAAKRVTDLEAWLSRLEEAAPELAQPPRHRARRDPAQGT
jgi:hypothetical protein